MSDTPKSWPTRTIKIPTYDWSIEVFDPSLAEIDQLGMASETSDLESMYTILSKLVVTWDAVNREGVPLGEPDSQTIRAIPQPVFKHLLKEAFAVAERDPKEELT